MYRDSSVIVQIKIINERATNTLARESSFSHHTIIINEDKIIIWICLIYRIFYIFLLNLVNILGLQIF